MNYSHLNKIQKRIISETLASAIGPRRPAFNAHPRDDEGSGPDGAGVAHP
jgi:hypothetical protein